MRTSFHSTLRRQFHVVIQQNAWFRARIPSRGRLVIVVSQKNVFRVLSVSH
jgi:hypothetical protein